MSEQKGMFEFDDDFNENTVVPTVSSLAPTPGPSQPVKDIVETATKEKLVAMRSVESQRAVPPSVKANPFWAPTLGSSPQKPPVTNGFANAIAPQQAEYVVGSQGNGEPSHDIFDGWDEGVFPIGAEPVPSQKESEVEEEGVEQDETPDKNTSLMSRSVEIPIGPRSQDARWLEEYSGSPEGSGVDYFKNLVSSKSGPSQSMPIGKPTSSWGERSQPGQGKGILRG